MKTRPRVALVMGSDSDYNTLVGCIKRLEYFNIDASVRVISAHRTPAEAAEFASNAKKSGIECIIAAAGKAAHLGGVIAAHTTLPVIGIPIKSSALDGLDSLLSTVQMPSGIPVATVAIDGAENAAILAAQILALRYDYIEKKLDEFKEDMRVKVMDKDKALGEKIEKEREND